MQQAIVRRLLLAILTFILASVVLSLVLYYTIPGDAVDLLAGEAGSLSPEGRARIAHRLGIDRSWPEYYWDWATSIITRWDFGDSFISDRDVWTDLRRRIPVTLEVSIVAIIITVVVSVPVGIIAAVRRDTLVDYVARAGAVLLLAVPSFWVATMFVAYPARWCLEPLFCHYAPPLNYVPFTEDPWSNLRIVLPPAAILGALLGGYSMRFVRTQMLEVMTQDYIRTAWAKGLRERTVILRHALRNAVIPVITVIGLLVPYVMGGTVILETIFSLPGMGRFVVVGILNRDYPVVQAIMLLLAGLVILVNFLIDLSYVFIDPRIRHV